MNYSEFIEIDPAKRFGRPVIKGTRIAVQDVLDWLSNGMSAEEIIADFPELNKAQIDACQDFPVNADCR